MVFQRERKRRDLQKCSVSSQALCKLIQLRMEKSLFYSVSDADEG